MAEAAKVLDRDGRTEHLFLDIGTGVRAVLREHDGRWAVRQNGPSRIWDAVETHITRWRGAGAPPLERFEITLTSEQPSIRRGGACCRRRRW
ncbi:hypothetical protein [Streptomyces sp. NEAU-W12]|uniref:hypothetical protein n=1 Tax=Streptomyces sp. NEAU-W12 TaxID=2994668 RepID=UPI00224A74E7|nr:hypothetical protein [Streptomyces sp. NEAU-W12]MCX2926173.1 hypothetical protein [Streptomyces sp. NEAU-W12]